MANGSVSISVSGLTFPVPQRRMIWPAAWITALAIRSLQALAREIRCLTIEHFSDRVLDRLEQLYGAVPMRLTLSKCAAPVPGFDGVVAVERARHGAP
jgi:hypothetical protein